MTREETLAILGVLRAAYPNFYKDKGKAELEGIVSLWTEMFSDDPAQIVAAAVKTHIATDAKGFPPHIGAIKNAIVQITKPPELEMTEQEAWGMVLRATQNGSYGAQKEFDKLPEVVQRIVGSPNQLREWAQMDADTVNSVVASNFMRSYRARAAHEREYLALPNDVKQAMRQLSGRMGMLELTEGN